MGQNTNKDNIALEYHWSTNLLTTRGWRTKLLDTRERGMELLYTYYLGVKPLNTRDRGIKWQQLEQKARHPKLSYEIFIPETGEQNGWKPDIGAQNKGKRNQST